MNIPPHLQAEKIPPPPKSKKVKKQQNFKNKIQVQMEGEIKRPKTQENIKTNRNLRCTNISNKLLTGYLTNNFPFV